MATEGSERVSRQPKGIKLMADFSADPLWVADPDHPDDGCMIELDEIPLRPDTVDRLRRWADAYERSINWDHPEREPWSAAEEDAFEQEGIRLWHLLRQELAPTYEVVYFSEQRRRVLAHPDELVEPTEQQPDAT